MTCPVAEDVPDKIAEVASAASVTLVAFDQGGPLMRRHGADSGIGQQVYEHILGVQQKQVVMRRAEEFLTLRTRGPTNEFDALDAEGLEYGLGRCMGAVLTATTSTPQPRLILMKWSPSPISRSRDSMTLSLARIASFTA